MDFRNQQIVITGGTSGLGRELALQLDRQGAKVAVTARRQEGLAALQAEAPGIITIQGDVARKDLIYPLAGEIQARLGRVDVLFNNASYLGATPLRLLLDTDCEDFEAVLQTNLLAPFRLIKALIPGMLLQKSGCIVNISSDAALNAYPTWGSYSIAKGGLDHLTRFFDAELQGSGVRFYAIDPGDMSTPMHAAALPEADPESLCKPRDAAAKILAFLRTSAESQRMSV